MARATSPRALSLDSPACSTRTLTSTFFLLLLPTLPALQLPAPRPSARPTTGTLILVRHGQTVWDRNAFVGWADPDLGFTGEQQAFDVARALRESGYTFDVAYTSLLKRVIGPTRPLPFPPTPSTLPLPPPSPSPFPPLPNPCPPIPSPYPPHTLPPPSPSGDSHNVAYSQGFILIRSSPTHFPHLSHPILPIYQKLGAGALVLARVEVVAAERAQLWRIDGAHRD